MLNNIKCYTFWFVIVLLKIQSIDSFSSGAGSCNAGLNALGGSHIDSTALQTLNLTLTQLEIQVQVGDAIYPANSVISVLKNTEYTILITTRTSDAFFRGALIRLETLNNRNMINSLEPNDNMGVVSVCTLPSVIGVSHTNNDMKTKASATFLMKDAGDIMMDVTIVVANTVGISMYGYGSFTIDVMDTLPPASGVQGGVSPSPSPSFFVTESFFPSYSISPTPVVPSAPIVTTPPPAVTPSVPVPTLLTPAPILPTITPAPVVTAPGVTPAPILTTPAPILPTTPAPILPTTPAPAISTPAPVLTTPAPVGPVTPAPVVPVTPAPIVPTIPTPVSASVRVPNYNPSQRVPETQRQRRDKHQNHQRVLLTTSSLSTNNIARNLRQMDQ